MQTVDTLRAARALITPKDARCTQVFFEHRGETISYCAVGAVGVAAGCDIGTIRRERFWEFPAVASALAALARALGSDGDQCVDVFRFNDRSAHDCVLALFDRAIANEDACEQEFTVTQLAPVEDREHVAA